MMEGAHMKCEWGDIPWQGERYEYDKNAHYTLAVWVGE